MNPGDKRAPGPGLRLAPPPGDLAELVQVFWQIARRPEEPHPWYLPVPGFELVFCDDGHALMPDRAGVHGPVGMLTPPRLEPSRFRPTRPVTLWGARLSAHALACLGWCHAEQAREFPLLANLLTEHAPPLLDGIHRADDFDDRCRAMAALLRAGPRLSRGPAARPAERALLRQCVLRGSLPQGPRARSRQRALQRAFQRWVGLSPESWRILQRFDEALRGLFEDPTKGEELAALAARLGYSDQAHLTRQFRRFAWAPPGEFQQTVRAWLAQADSPTS